MAVRGGDTKVHKMISLSYISSVPRFIDFDTRENGIDCALFKLQHFRSIHEKCKVASSYVIRMSRYRDSDDVAACRMLQSVGSGLEIDQVEHVWDMITKRFPNSAPLLCELKTVIDRAEVLLKELRGPKCSTRILTRKTRSITLADSDVSDDESDDATAAETADVQTNIAETQISNSSGTESEPGEDVHLPSRQSVACKDKSSILNRGTPECKSIEDWDKIIDSTDSIGAPTEQSGCSFDKQSLDIGQIVGNNNDEVGDFPYELPISKEDISESKATWRSNEEGKGDVHTSSPSKSRVPQQLLKEYATRCGVSIDYHLPKDAQRSKRYAITCRVAEYTATALAETPEEARNNAAIKILKMIADCQMDDSILVRPLLHFTRQEMLEVISFCANIGQENVQRRLYKLCLDRGDDIPRYDLQRKNTSNGFIWAATCIALGHTASGEGVRKNVAKRVAAENLYQRYVKPRH